MHICELVCSCMVNTDSHAWLDTWVLGLWTLVFMFVEQALCPLSHQPSTCLWLWIIGLGNWISPLLVCFWCVFNFLYDANCQHLTSLLGCLCVSWSISFPFPPTSFFFQASHRGWSFLFQISRQCPHQAYLHVTCKPSSSWSQLLYSYQFKGLCHSKVLFKQIKENLTTKNLSSMFYLKISRGLCGLGLPQWGISNTSSYSSSGWGPDFFSIDNVFLLLVCNVPG